MATHDLSKERGLNRTISAYWPDHPSDMTYGRRLAQKLSRFNWYFPQVNPIPDENESQNEQPTATQQPNLDHAWAFFEHYALPRRLANKLSVDTSRSGKYDRAEPGEHDVPTKLYPVISTPQKDMGDFGIGVGLYFSALQSMAVLMFLAGLINIPIMNYYTSQEYSSDKKSGLNVLLKTSAICTDTEWVPCPNCKEENNFGEFPTTEGRLAFGISPEDGSETVFILKNNCMPDSMVGILTLASVSFLTIGIFYFMYHQRQKAVNIDEAEQTTADYSICVTNPPPDAKDPEKWKQFFESNFDDVKVSACTVAVDNDTLIRACIRRRKLLLQIQNLLPVGVDFNPYEDPRNIVDQCLPVPGWKKWLCCAGNAEQLCTSIEKENAIIADLCERDPSVCQVFITFEKECQQRLVMKKLSIPVLERWQTGEDMRFEGTALIVQEPDEPSSIRWEDLDEKTMTRVFQQITSTIISAILIGGGAVLIALAHRIGVWASSYTIIGLNTLTPMFVRWVMTIESHPNQSSYMASQYIKMTVFRWVNTAIVMVIITSFTDTLQKNGLVTAVNSLFIGELVTRPVLQLSDIMGNLNRHYFGPRAADQRRMNLCFMGSQYEIGERYTDVTKVLFLTVFYSNIYPLGFFYAAAMFIIWYFVDKFSMLRIWRQGPRIGSKLYYFSELFFVICLVVYSVFSAYSYSAFPSDNVCTNDETISSSYVGSYNISPNDGSDKVSITVSDQDQSYKFCNQDLLKYSPAAFPALSTFQPAGYKWMIDSQSTYTNALGWYSLVILSIACIWVLYRVCKGVVLPLFIKTYKPVGKTSNLRFDDSQELDGYVPSVSIPGYEYPFLLCDVDGLDEDLIGWKDPLLSYDFHNMIFDVPKKIRRIEVSITGDENEYETVFSEAEVENARNLWSKVKYWPEALGC